MPQDKDKKRKMVLYGILGLSLVGVVVILLVNQGTFSSPLSGGGDENQITS